MMFWKCLKGGSGPVLAAVPAMFGTFRRFRHCRNLLGWFGLVQESCGESCQPPTRTLLSSGIWTWEAPGGSFISTHCSDHRYNTKPTFHHNVTALSKKGSLWFRCKQGWTDFWKLVPHNFSERNFWRSLKSWGTHLSSFFTFPGHYKTIRYMTSVLLTPRPSATSRLLAVDYLPRRHSSRRPGLV